MALTLMWLFSSSDRGDDEGVFKHLRTASGGRAAGSAVSTVAGRVHTRGGGPP